ncbi:hypothetical protein VB779_05705 [Haloarculaceae archaeon H-GB11]|nr:hypothetical protein [Haloarculaceae archaeon H-GB11]
MSSHAQAASLRGLLGTVGVVLAVVQVLHGLQQTTVLVAQLVDAVPFAAAGLAMAYTGYWLSQEPEYEGDMERILLWGAGGALAFLSVAALMLFGQQVTLGTLNRASYVAVDNITIGILSGVLVGLYDAQSRGRLRELQAERDRIERFAQKAADVNNYGRAILQASVVEEVAAYSIEAVETLTGFYETAFVEIVDDEIEIVGSTWTRADDETVAKLARSARRQSPREAEISATELPASLDENVEQVLTALVTDDGDTAAVLISVSHSEDDVDEADAELLELLVSHAGEALDGIYRRQSVGNV